MNDRCPVYCLRSLLFFFNDTATTEIYTLSLHDALPIYYIALDGGYEGFTYAGIGINWYRHHFIGPGGHTRSRCSRSGEDTAELQAPCNIVCRLLLVKKKLTSMAWYTR